jgi:hypothetical protein
MKKSFRKLSLNRETLRHLERQEMGVVQGATGETKQISCNTVCTSCRLEEYSDCDCTITCDC